MVSLLFLMACNVDAVGFPVDTGVEWFETEEVWEDDDQPSGCAEENEPNDLQTKEGTDYDWAGLLHEGREISMCGHLSQTGVRNDGTYNGDLDYVFFELAEATRIHAVVTTEPGAEIDLHVFDVDGAVDAAYGGGPWEGRLGTGFPLLLVVSPDGPTADWHLEVWVD